MPTTRAIPRRNTTQGTREIDGFTIKFTAVFVDTAGLFQIKIVDHFGDETSDFASDTEVFGTIYDLVEMALLSCRTRAKEMAGVE